MRHCCCYSAHAKHSSDESATAQKNSGNEAAPNLFFIGQDLDAIRDYSSAECCAAADGATAYIGLYNVLSEEAVFGGLGLGADGKPTELEGSWGAGAVSAYKTAKEFGVKDLAIGLFIAENDHPGALDQLLAGAHDDKVRQLAKLFKHVDGDAYLRIGYEFDGVWNAGQDDRKRYITAWRRIVDLLREEGDQNVYYVWQGSASPIDDVIEKKRENIEDWYPGDDYVDWIGLSWFFDGDEAQSVDADYEAPTGRELADELLAFARARNKPVMVAEAAPQGYDLKNLTSRHHSPIWDGDSGSAPISLTADQIWEAWFSPFFQYVHDNDDVIDAIAYISCNWDEQPMWGPPYESGYWGDTRVTQNETITKRWNAAIDAWRGR